ncbi:MAG: mercuric reductase [Gemmatimonadetes bacterium]|nr:mercuric reductase [Gemmatimonadota bacterium]
MTTMTPFDLIAIGGGTAGLVTAAGAASLGLRAALVEREALGGDCLWTGCVPSKALIASAKLAHQMRHAAALGLEGASPGHAFRTVMERMRTVRARVAEHDDPERFRKMGVDVVFGSARLEAPDRVSVDGRVLQSSRIVIATGALPSAPPIEGLETAGFLTHANAFDQDELPARIAMVGGGPIGLEFAQIYRRLGAAVTVVEVLPTLLPREDPDVGRLMAELLEAEGIAIRVGHGVERVTRGADGTKALHLRDADGAGHVLEVDEIFVATGRPANTDGLGLEEIGVRLDRGAVKVDATLRSNVKGIWAAGDVTGGLQFTHVAEYQAKLVLRNAFFPFPRKASYATVPWVTYTDPEVARVGLTELEAQERFDRVKTYRYPFADLDRAIVDGHTEGFIKIVTRKNGRIVGATVLGSGAGDLILPVVMAMNARMKISQLSHIVYPYPTMVEGVKRAADSYYRERFAGRTGEWLRKVVRWLK